MCGRCRPVTGPSMCVNSWYRGFSHKDWSGIYIRWTVTLPQDHRRLWNHQTCVQSIRTDITILFKNPWLCHLASSDLDHKKRKSGVSTFLDLTEDIILISHLTIHRMMGTRLPKKQFCHLGGADLDHKKRNIGESTFTFLQIDLVED